MGKLRKMKINIKDILLIIIFTISLSADIKLISEKFDTTKELAKQTTEIKQLEAKLEGLTDKKNTLMLICLEKGKRKPNKPYLDSLEISYYLD